MASPGVGSVPPKMSFAKVQPNTVQPHSVLTQPSQVAALNVPTPSKPSNNSNEDKKVHAKESTNRRSTIISSKRPAQSPSQKTPQPAKAEVSTQAPDLYEAGVAIEGLSLVNQPSSTIIGAKSNESADSAEDDQSHLSNSSTKQQSFDTKSMASVTTFAMDEKESIRPDDSASVRAGDDEDMASSLSRNLPIQQESGVTMPTLRGGAAINGAAVTMAARRYPTLTNPPRFGDLDPPVPPSDVSETTSSSLPAEHSDDSNIRVPVPPVSPDEKLLDALASPKDRLSILQLEERLLAFITLSKLEFIDLPPQNSYARLLAHKLADYYSLLHRINEDCTSIRIFRSLPASLPTPLHILAQSIPVGSAQNLPTAVKIMRRAGIGPRQFSTTNSTAPSSSVPSKATSEAGHSEEGIMSPMDGAPGRNKPNMTREEREAQYKAARDRIFGDLPEIPVGDSVSTGENSADMSRSSSSSGKRKVRRQKTPKDDTFEARSAYVPSGYGNNMHVHAPYQQQQYVDQGFQNPIEASPASFPQQVNYGSTPTQAYPGFDQNMQGNPMNFSPVSPQNLNLMKNWSNMQPQPTPNSYFNFPQSQGGYAPNMQHMMPQVNPQYMQQIPPQMQQPGNWVNNQYQNPYQSPISPSQGPPNWPNYQPQPYGQMSNQFAMNTQATAFDVSANSMNRSLFNPQTRSFVPSTTTHRNGSRNGRRKNPSLPTFQSQSRNGSNPKLHGSGNIANGLMSAPKGPSQDGFRSSSTSSSPPSREESLQKRYGAPSHLPKKPPPSQFDAGPNNAKAAGGASTNSSERGTEGNVDGRVGMGQSAGISS